MISQKNKNDMSLNKMSDDNAGRNRQRKSYFLLFGLPRFFDLFFDEDDGVDDDPTFVSFIFFC